MATFTKSNRTIFSLAEGADVDLLSLYNFNLGQTFEVQIPGSVISLNTHMSPDPLSKQYAHNSASEFLAPMSEKGYDINDNDEGTFKPKSEETAINMLTVLSVKNNPLSKVNFNSSLIGSDSVIPDDLVLSPEVIFGCEPNAIPVNLVRGNLSYIMDIDQTILSLALSNNGVKINTISVIDEVGNYNPDETYCLISLEEFELWNLCEPTDVQNHHALAPLEIKIVTDDCLMIFPHDAVSLDFNEIDINFEDISSSQVDQSSQLSVDLTNRTQIEVDLIGVYTQPLHHDIIIV